MIRFAVVLALALLLTACGGGGEGGPTVPTPQQPPREVVQEPPVVPPEPALWEAVWSEDWSAPVFGGWVRHTILSCQFGDPDPDRLRGREFRGADATWSYFSSTAASAWPDSGVLRIKGYSAGAILGWPTFDRTRQLRLTAVVDLVQSEASWVGLTLIQDESDYREIALEWYGDGLWVELYAPCYAQRLARVEPGPRQLTLQYEPGVGWRYIVDDVEVHFEPMNHRNAQLAGDPRAGIYWHVHRRQAGPVEATVGPLKVEQR